MYERRLKIFLFLVGLGLAVILGRLVQMQLVRGADYWRQAEDKLVEVDILSTKRGDIVDRKDRKLATDQPCYEFCLDYRLLAFDEKAYDLSVKTADLSPPNRWVRQQVRAIAGKEGVSHDEAAEKFRAKVEHTWRLASKLTGTSRNDMAMAAARAAHRVAALQALFAFRVREERIGHPIVGGLDAETAVELRPKIEEMIGASVRTAHWRSYPEGEAACHVIGRIGEVGPEEQKQFNEPRETRLEEIITHYRPGDRIGKTGVEKLCEPIVRGWRGYRKRRIVLDDLHKGPDDQLVGEVLEDVPPRFGQTAQLTLDIELQRELAGILGRPGAIVVIDVPTGEVLAMVSLPTYDLNAYDELYPQLSANTVDLPMWNRCVAVRYPPGSTFKPMAAMAGLSVGVLGPATTHHCKGYLYSPEAFRCWIQRYGVGHGDVNVVQALEGSCNVFFYMVGEDVGLPRMNRWLEGMGFAGECGTGLPEERPGRLPDPKGTQGSGEARFLAIGQGEVEVTPMHVANAMAAIARGGEFRSPLLVRQLAARQVVRRLDIKPEHVRLVQEGMYRVVNAEKGTAHKFAYDPEIAICGKTGTAQTAPRREGIDDDGDGTIDRWGEVIRSGDTAWFAGFAPYEAPKIAFAVVVEYSDAGGGATCGPIGRQVVQVCKQRGYLK